MTELVLITLENEMDLTLAYKRSILTAGMLGLTIATQTAFATAVSEVCREVIDKARNGVAKLGTVAESGRFFIVAMINCEMDADFNKRLEGLEYARKLLPVVDVTSDGTALQVILKLGIPRSTRIDQRIINGIKKQIEADGNVSAYEEVKQRNALLNNINQQQEMALLHANYLNEQKTEFFSIASHELNAPLAVLRGYVQMALHKLGEDSGPLKNYLVKIDQQGLKITNLIQQMLDITKIEQGKINYNKQLTGFNAFLINMLDAAQLLVPTHNITVELGDDCNVMIDHLRIEQVFNNLIGNAAKYSSSGSAIIVRTSASGNHVVCEVQDYGIGISPETQQLIFEKFYRDKKIENTYNGLGMGLYITSHILNDHGGTISVNSENGKGSVFSFSLPIH